MNQKLKPETSNVPKGVIDRLESPRFNKNSSIKTVLDRWVSSMQLMGDTPSKNEAMFPSNLVGG